MNWYNFSELDYLLAELKCYKAIGLPIAATVAQINQLLNPPNHDS